MVWAGDGPLFLANNINADPLFVSLGVRDFRLQATSPASNTAVSTLFKWDYGGFFRPQGLAYDLGAHEIAITVILTPTAYIFP